MFQTEWACLANCTINAEPKCNHFNTGWNCKCFVGFAEESLCTKTIFEMDPSIKKAYIIYSSLGLLVMSIGMLISLYEVYLQLFIYHREWKNVSFIGKLLCILFPIVRIYHFSVYLHMVLANDPPSSTASRAVSELFLWVGYICGMILLFMCTVVWLNLVMSLKLNQNKKLLKIIKNTLLVLSMVFFPVGFIFITIRFTANNVLFTFLLIALLGPPLYITAIFCLVQVGKMHFLLSNLDPDLAPKFRRKNMLLGLIAFFYIIDAGLTMAYYLTLQLIPYDTKYTIVPNYIIRTSETIEFYLYLKFFAQYSTNEPSSTQNSSSTQTTKNIKPSSIHHEL